MTVKPYNTSSTKKEEVRGMFDNIASRYDFLNHALSFNIDRWWRRQVAEEVRRGAPQRILDMATGTGDLAVELARRILGAQITGVDLSEKMLAEARRKVAARGLSERIALQQGDAEHPAGDAVSFDAATVAFGVRNFGDLHAGLCGLARAIKPGGKLVILEFSRPRNPLFRALFGFYFCKVLPFVGGMVSHDRQAYAYLPASVGEFPSPEAFVAMMGRAGFRNCRTRSLSCGIAHIYIGETEVKTF